MNYWLLKTEPDAYSWNDLAKDGSTVWNGVRNFQARNNMRAMQVGDYALLYHSVKEKQIVGIVRIIKEAYQDPTTTDAQWVVVDIEPVKACTVPVTLTDIKSNAALSQMRLLIQPRLSVCPLSPKEWKEILKMAQTTL